MNNLKFVIIKTKYSSLGETSEVELLGKPMLEWVAKIATNPTILEDSATVFDKVKSLKFSSGDIVVLLYSDTPLITKKTVLEAAAMLKRRKSPVLRLTRGFVYKASAIMTSTDFADAPLCYFDEEDFITAFSPKQVALITDILRQRINNYHLERGVLISDMASCNIGPDVEIEKGVKIGTNNIISGNTKIFSGANIIANSIIENSVIHSGVSVNSSQIYKSTVGENTTVGPFAYIRPDTVIGKKCRIGDFVELKKCTLGDETKVSHLSYVGDATVGSGCNIGCGVVFVNYDGKKKHHTVVEDKAFIGSNANIIAPVTIGEGAFIAAGSTINRSVPKGNYLAIARARQENKEGYSPLK